MEKHTFMGAGKPEEIWTADHDSFLESMADAAKSVMDYEKTESPSSMSCVIFLWIVTAVQWRRIRPWPTLAILSSLDPVALDQACVDLVYQSEDQGKAHLIERIESRNGIHTIEAAAALGIGSREYELIDLDKES